MYSKCFLTVTFLVICGCKTGYGADEVLRCPDIFVEGKVNTLTVNINQMAVASAECFLAPKKVTFSRRRVRDDPKGPSHVMCETDFSCQNMDPVIANGEGAECGCVKRFGDVLTFDMKFIANKDLDTSANFSAQVCAFPGKPYTKDIQKSCTSAKVGQGDLPHTMPGITSQSQLLVTVQTEITLDEQDGSPACGTVCIVLVVLGVLGALMGIAVAFIIVRRRRKWGGGQPVPT